MASNELLLAMESGNTKGKEISRHAGRTAHNMSSSSLRKKSDLTLVSKVRYTYVRMLLANLQEVLLGTKLCFLFPAIPLAIVAHYCNFGRHKVDVVKYSLLGSILSNLLLVLGTSLLCGGLANLNREQKFDRKQADVNSTLLLLALLCHLLPLMFRYVGKPDALTAKETLQLSRASSIIMLIGYFAYLVFQLWTHRQFFEAQEAEDDDDKVISEEAPVIGFWSGFIWLAGMTAIIALLSEYVVGTIEDASESWGISVSFISIVLLPIVGNAAEHAGAVIFAFKNKLDITLGVALGSATQIAMFVVPLSVIVAWIVGINMDLDFNLLETSSLALAVIVTSFTLQDGTSHYMKGFVLLLCYIVIGACFLVYRMPTSQAHVGVKLSAGEISRV
ncbi:hypothetical protein RJ639_003604 [Escallonia herrerae]|uniref:Vacuolar cation/proton exchanger n=1 Tax=Escallonia herrerae TaxID=1293975 RepID=A0AA88W0P4_9ASTE|nr:hypothetical protein RJ639_003604 [Escallonia herrerae]